ncbi:Mur ligase [Aspergillus transmontanensis]|uniref:UDP-N-acetylmuramate--L-alanine ligase n=1 Tax=Aspergillus transmontanensis TaxID=1034304 RepID=A0A5N6WDL5_9EURO|nr:Mur ligase [Aspergillus transmontanensis]
MLSTDLQEALRYESPAHMPGFPPSISPIHFVCIGGHGQSAIALILLKLGYVVQGSDIKESDNVVRLRAAGATVFIGHDKDQLGSAKLVVASSAATKNKPNVEVEAARDRRIPVIHRSEMLASLMRHHKSIAISGSHGKSTTTSMVAGMLEAGGLSPTTISGAVVTQYGSNAHLGSGNWMVVEADESDGTMVRLPALISVVTNIDSDHITFYGTQEKTRATFAQFVRNVPFYGLAVLCIDDPGVRKILPEVQDRNIITYGVSEDADVRAENVKYNPQDSTFVLSVRSRRDGARRVVGPIVLNVLGLHNLQNALATTAIALELGIELESIRHALGNFQGTNRRYIHVGEANGIQIIDDFGTHPAEIKATQTMAKQAGARRVIAVYQPTIVVKNVEAWLEEYPAAFEESAHIIIGQADGVEVDPVPAGEARETLVQYLHSHGREDAISMPDPSALPELVSRLGQEGDFVVCMGFRSSTLWARALAGQLKALGTPRMEGDQ